jgi:hypothetical protein
LPLIDYSMGLKEQRIRRKCWQVPALSPNSRKDQYARKGKITV